MEKVIEDSKSLEKNINPDVNPKIHDSVTESNLSNAFKFIRESLVGVSKGSEHMKTINHSIDSIDSIQRFLIPYKELVEENNALNQVGGYLDKNKLNLETSNNKLNIDLMKFTKTTNKLQIRVDKLQAENYKLFIENHNLKQQLKQQLRQIEQLVSSDESSGTIKGFS